MRAVTNFFLRAKHWHIFFLLFGIGYIGGAAALLLRLAHARSPEDLLRVNLPFGVVMVLSMFCLVAWLWSMGSFLNSIGQPALRLRLGFFRFALLYPAVYIIVFLVLFGITKPALIAVIFPLHFFAMFCLFYDLYLVSKSLALIETGKPVSFPDYAGSFFLLWFFPIGVWFIQPRINRLYAQPLSRQEGITPTDMCLPVAAPTPRTVGNSIENPTGTPPAYAGFWLRCAASLIDGFLISFPLFILVFIAITVVRIVNATRGRDPSIGILAALLAITFLVPWLYFSLLESSPWQATIGKIVLRLYVTDLEGNRLTRGRAMGRNLAKFLSNLTIGVGHLMCGFTAKKQTLHDVLAKCLVLRRPKS
ncbi:MAG: RDD family protein [Candidatus Acidiferrum sp.]